MLRGSGTSVVFLDSNPRNCRRAEEAGFPVVFGDGVQERTLMRARPQTVGTAIGLTPNQMVNSVFVSRARERFGVPQGYVAVAQADSGLAPELVESPDVAVLFDGPHDVNRWDVRCRHGQVEVEPWRYRGPGEEGVEIDAALTGGERFVVLAIRRGGKTLPMHPEFKLQEGDVAAVAVHTPEAGEAREALRSAGWEPQPVDEPR